MIDIKQLFRVHKYLFHSVSLLIALPAILAIRLGNVGAIFYPMGLVLLEALVVGVGVYLLQMFAGRILYPVIPKSEDFENNEERDAYFGYKQETKNLLWLMIYLIIAVVLALNVGP